MHNTILNSEVFLDHIAIESANPKKIAEFYSKKKFNDDKRNVYQTLNGIVLDQIDY